MLTCNEIVTALQNKTAAKVGDLVMAWDDDCCYFVKGRLVKFTRIETADTLEFVYTVETDYEGRPTYDYGHAVGMR